MKLLKNEGDAYEEVIIKDSKGFRKVVSDLKKQATDTISTLNDIKKSALQDLKGASDATVASKYASLIIWKCNTFTNKIYSLTISTINRASKLYSKKESK